MKTTILSYQDCLDDYVLNSEFSKLANISKNAYRFWSDVKIAKYPNSNIVFLHKLYINKKYTHIIPQCTDLSGYVLASAFCHHTNLSRSHLVSKNNSKLYDVLDIISPNKVKLINLRDFLHKYNIPANAHIYIEKCCFFGPSPFEKKIKLTDVLCLGYY